MQFRFIQPLRDGGIAQVTIEAAKIEDAFPRYALNHWNPDEEAAVVVYQDNFIIGQVLPRYSPYTKDMMAVFTRI